MATENAATPPLIPSLVLRNAAAAIEFYRQLFDAQVVSRLDYPGTNRVMHAELRLQGRPLMLGEEAPAMGSLAPQALGGPSPVTLMLYVPDTDALFQKAVALGSTAIMPPADMFWGDRFAKFTDPYGHVWSIATHLRDVPEAEIREAAARMFPPS